LDLLVLLRSGHSDMCALSYLMIWDGLGIVGSSVFQDGPIWKWLQWFTR